MNDRFCFKAEWYEDLSETYKPFNLLYYPADDTIELNQTNLRKTFLSRSKCRNISMDDLFIGNTINIYCRNFKILEYADEFTKNSFLQQNEVCIFMLKAQNMDKLSDVIKEMEIQRLLMVSGIKMFKIDPLDIDLFESSLPEFSRQEILNLLKYQIIAVKVTGSNSNNILNNEMNLKNKFDYVTRSNDEAEFLSGVIFDAKENILRSTATYQNTSLCIIKPHVIKEKNLGNLLTKLSPNINAIGMFRLNYHCAIELYQVYKTVLPDYEKMVKELTSGVCVAIEINSKVDSFRDFCGPYDPEIAKNLYPKSLRANFGHNRIKNAVHCTDLSDDSIMEVEYFFKLLWEK
ncbi:hypothetical protein A3Q56_02784 [Intoshia linei]|uniref:DM10 domain-containing protein n=1 Tax=Intoshia linei TaxID=1819745 RepID=A0A177B749_9BILA|nr:hypothetical protein A3Q56_02784 [Intoshia linei]